MTFAHLKVVTHGFSHIGQRDENQDRLAVLESSDDGVSLLVVADGLGGHTGGSLAAETTVTTAERCWRSRDREQSPESFLSSLVRECHDAVRRAAREQGLDAHSTVAALVLKDGQAISVHAGDSRVMQYSETSFIGRTVDHSVAQLLALRGTITDDEIAGHPDQNKLFAQVGGHTPPEPEIKRWDLAEGTRFVLCSDGFWEIFGHDEIVELFMSDDPETELRERFESKLSRLERHDNTTAILAEVFPGEAVSGKPGTADATRQAGTDRGSNSRSRAVPKEPAAADATPVSGSPGDVARAGGTTAERTSPEIVAPHSRLSRTAVGRARASVIGAMLLLLLHAGGAAIAQRAGVDGEAGQVEGVPVSTTQGESTEVTDSGEPEVGEADGADGNAESGGLPDGLRESLPIRLQSSDATVDLPIEPGEDIAQTVEEELRQRRQLGTDDSLANVGASEQLGEVTVLRMRQDHRGIPVFAAEIVVSTLADRIVRIAGDSTPNIDLESISPSNDYATAIALAEMRTGLTIAPQDDGELLVFPAENGGRLVWSGPAAVEQGLEPAAEEAASQTPTQSLEQVYVDAANGEVLLRLPLVHQVLDRRVYDFSQACRDAGIGGPMNARTAMARASTLMRESPLVRSETVGGWHRNAERLFDTLGAYYRFLQLVLDVDSIDDAGKPLVGYIGARFDEGIPATPQCSGDEFMAFWMPTDAMILTDAVLDFPELIGHEATHGLIGHGSRLIYQFQSGALHESIADSLGVALRAWNESGAPPDIATEVTMDTGNWRIRAPSSVIRDLQTPANVRLPGGTPLPDHYDDYMYLPADIDDGGVHVNSSIMNHGFYLLAEGGRHRRLGHDPEVDGVGIMKAARIVGAAAAWLLTPASDFADARYAFAHAAEALHGEDSEEWIAVHIAMDAIGIPGTWERPLEPEPARPAAEPELPATVPTSPTSAAPHGAPEPTNSTTPTSTAPSAPGQDTLATPPQEQAPSPAEEPISERNDSLNRAERTGYPLVLFLVGALTLAGAAIIAYVYRPGRSSPTRWKPPSWQSPNQAASGSIPASFGTLSPADGTAAIPLQGKLLTSREGMVVGRAANICHVQLGDPTVSRRHVRLRWANGALLVEDLNSAAGTRLDGTALRPFRPRRVNAGQTLRIAGLPYAVEIAGQASTATDGFGE